MSYPKETVEVVKGFLALSVVLAEQFKDGVQATDLAPILAKLQSEPLASKLKDAYNGVDKIKDEFKGFSVVDALTIIPDLMPDVLALVAAVHKAP